MGIEGERLKALFWPFRMSEYFKRFEQKAQSLDESSLENELSAPTYRHKLRDMMIRGTVGLSIVYGISTIVKPTSELTLFHWIYMFSLGPQALALSLLSATRAIMIQNEEKILSAALTSRQVVSS